MTLLGVESQEINRQIVYGNPLGWAIYLDYYQGDNAQRIMGACLYVAIENLFIQMGFFEPKTNYSPSRYTIDQLETAIIKNVSGTYDIKNIVSEINTLYGSEQLNTNNLLKTEYVGMATLGNYVKSGYCVAAMCDAYALWGLRDSFQTINHVVTVTGVAYSINDSSAIEGFYICDSGRLLQSDASRYIPYSVMSKMIGGGTGTIIVSNEPIKQYLDNIDGTGNELNNTITGNSGKNSLYGLGGNDTLNGAGSYDTLYCGIGDDSYYVNAKDTVVELANEGNDTIYAIADKEYTLVENIENLVLSDSVCGVKLNGNNLNNSISGGAFNDILNGELGDDNLDGKAGADILIGGLGDDTYYIDNIRDAMYELANQGTDTVKSTFSHTLAANFENLELLGSTNINATGNAYNNLITSNSGNNVINGYLGTDTLTGGVGNDTYIFIRGYGIDNITDASGLADQILFGSNVSKSKIAMFIDDNDDLLIDYGTITGADRITIKDWATEVSNQVEKLKLSNGTFLTNTDINKIIQDITAFATNNEIELSNISDFKSNSNIMTIVSNSWHR